VHRLLDPARTGPAGAATRDAAEISWTLGLSGTLIVVAFAWVLVRAAPNRGSASPLSARLAALLTSPPAGLFAVGVGVAAFVLTAIVAAVVHGGAPTSVDGMAQMLHAQALVTGKLTVPLKGDGAAWVVQNGLVADGGWVSIYPPLHTLFLAGGILFGAPWLVGPLATGIATGAISAAAERLLGAGPGRVTGLLLLVSPFWLLIGATHLSHPTAAAALALVLLCAIVARQGGLGWAIATGAAVGMAVSARPWIGVACSTALLLALWIPDLRHRSASSAGRRLGALLLGGAPFAALLLWWNTTLFGSPLRLGYSAAFGPAHALGLHRDPWGNLYSATEALAYTGADLSLLGVRLLESPLPLIAVVGVLLLMRPVQRGQGVFLAWAGVALVANALYWHHGLLFGPRMMFESAPAWLALFAIAAVAAFRDPAITTQARVTRWTIGIAVLGGIAFSPFVMAGARSPNPSALPTIDGDSAIVFVHGSWASRSAARLAAAGMRRDSIETALRRNDICAVDRYARWRAGGAAGRAPTLDFEPLPGTPVTLESRELSPGNLVRVSSDGPHDDACSREARADRFGILELEFLAWQAPPFADRAVIFARDLGPAGNLPVLDSTDRTPWIYIDAGPERGLILLDYAEGMELLWGGAAREGLTR